MEPGFVFFITGCAVILGFAVGMIIGKLRADRRYKRDTQHTQGTINVDNSDPEFEPDLFLALGVPVDSITSKKYVMLDVKVIGHNSHE